MSPFNVVPSFDPTTAFRNVRRADPETSRLGATRIRDSDRANVLRLFRQAGERGLTDREVQAASPESRLARLESWRKRRSDLSRDGYLVETEARRGGQIVWRAGQRRLF